MAKSTRKKTPPKKSVVKQKKIGRPRSTGAGLAMMVRMHKPQVREIDQWIGDSDISRPEAIRQLVDWALSQVKKPEEPETINIVRRAREAELRR
jgi:hypothetical protein